MPRPRHHVTNTFVRTKNKEENEEAGEGCERDVNIVTLGNKHVGKTGLLFQFSTAVRADTYMPTVGYDYVHKVIETHDGRLVNVKLWDTAGPYDKNEIVAKDLFKMAAGFIIMYDVTDIQSYNDVYNWMNLLDKYALDNSYVVIVGNKTDLIDDRKISKEEGVHMAACYNAKFMETSVFSGRNINKTVRRMTSNIVDHLE